MKKDLWLFFKYSIKFILVVVEIVYGFALYDIQLSKSVNERSPYILLILGLFFVVSVEFNIVMNEKVLPYLESKLTI